MKIPAPTFVPEAVETRWSAVKPSALGLSGASPRHRLSVMWGIVSATRLDVSALAPR